MTGTARPLDLDDFEFVADDRSIRWLRFRRGTGRPRQEGPRLARDLARYLAGERVAFADYVVDWADYTPFQRAVLEATRAIPYGATRTYGALATAVGRPGGARAVGQVLGRNRHCVVVPCHRVVATDGLGGFTGGLHRKRALLELEGDPPEGRATRRPRHGSGRNR